MEPLCLFVDVPMSSFRPMWSREYQETYPAPPPSTIYGMLLSLIGVERKEKSEAREHKNRCGITEPAGERTYLSEIPPCCAS